MDNKSFCIVNWSNEIKKSNYDSLVGISIAKIIDDDICGYITIIESNKSVNPHYHTVGKEHYHIISGQGQIKLRCLDGGNIEIHNVSAGESFIVNENVVHELSNIGNDNLVLMFYCKEEHLSSDRHLV